MLCQFAQSVFARNLYYARWKDGEVDLVHCKNGGDLSEDPIEIKWSDRVDKRPKEEVHGLIEFCRNNRLSKAWVYTRTLNRVLKVDEIDLFLQPVSGFAYLAAILGVESPLKEGLFPTTISPTVSWQTGGKGLKS